MPAEPADSGVGAAGAAGEPQSGLADALRTLGDHLQELTGVGVLQGADAVDGGLSGAERDADSEGRSAARADYAFAVEPVRLLVPAYQAQHDVSRVDAHVLVTASGPDPLIAADHLADAMLRLLGGGDWTLVPGEPSTDLWRGLGRPVRPGFMVSVPLSREVPQLRPPLVRESLDVRSGGLRQVRGRVLAADGTPLSGARVRLRPDGRPTRTTYDGSWSLSLPTREVVLEVFARGTLSTHPLSPSTQQDPAGSPPVDLVVTDLGQPTASTPSS